MGATPWKLVPRNLMAHKVRSGLTVLSVAIALFLLCFLQTIVTSLDQAVKQADDNRLVVQSAVSLFVNLPLDYQAKIESVPGVDATSKMTWFGAVYQDPSNFFAQFAVDHERYFDLYSKEMEIVEGPNGSGPGAREDALAALAAERRGCIIGRGLQRDFGFQVGDTVPLLPSIYAKNDGSAWDFVVCGVYEPLKANVDDRTLWFRHDYLKETMFAQGVEDLGVSTYAVNLAPGASAPAVIAQIDGLFDAGPQRTQTVTEAAFQAIFVNMMGNLPFLVGSVGGAVIFALLFSVVNTMSMAARQRQHEAGILKALGFANGAVSRVFFVESVLITFTGGLFGAGLALLTSEPFRRSFSMFPGYQVLPATAFGALGISLVVGVLAGLAPAFSAARTSPVAALRSEG